MPNIFKKEHNAANLPQSDNLGAQGSGKKGLLICETCKAVYFEKRWHRNMEALNNKESRAAFEHDTPTKFTLCPACAMIKNGQYEGRVRINNIPPDFMKDLEGLINGFCERAYERDSMHRLIALDKKDGEWTVTLTENQLAHKLGQKIKDVFNAAKVETHFAPEPSGAAEVKVTF